MQLPSPIYRKKKPPDYPDNWQAIATAVKDATNWSCENCGHLHDIPAGYMLTVHHLDMDKTNCDYTNLVALCQRCHLRIQVKYVPGQQWLFEPPAWATLRGLPKATGG